MKQRHANYFLLLGILAVFISVLSLMSNYSQVSAQIIDRQNALLTREEYELGERYFPGGFQPVACTQDVRQCPDSSEYVSRDPFNNCEFRPCPGDENYVEASPISIRTRDCQYAVTNCYDVENDVACQPRIICESPLPDVSPLPTSCTSDLNNDFVTNILDFVILKNTFMVSPPNPTEADMNGDGIVNMLDVSLLVRHFGEACEYNRPLYSPEIWGDPDLTETPVPSPQIWGDPQ